MNTSIKSFLLIAISNIAYSGYTLSMNPTGIYKNGYITKKPYLVYWYPHIVPNPQDITNAEDFDQDRLDKIITPIFKKNRKVKKYIPRAPINAIVIYDPTPTQTCPPSAPVKIHQPKPIHTYQPREPHTQTYPL